MKSHLGYTLKCHRIAAGLTREQVAVRSGLSPYSIAAMEQGARGSINAIATVLRCYGMTLGDLLPVDEDGRENAIADCIKDAVNDYTEAMALDDMSSAELV